MVNIIDPCQISPVMSGLVLTLGAIITLHYQDFCLPLIDYVKFTAICILIFFYYQAVIKLEPQVCGNNGASMWSSICASILITSAIIGGICVKFKQAGEISAYIGLIFCFLPLTLCCIFRLFHSKGPLNGEFWDPTTITKIYI